MTARAQPGLFVEETPEHLHVEWTLRSEASVADVIAAVAKARRDSAFLRGPNQVWGFAPSLLRRLSDDMVPSDVQDFAGVSGPAGTAPSTQHSIWLWAAGNSWEKIWRSCRAADNALSGVAGERTELRCFTAIDDRDTTGFIDGTENPEVDEALRVALYPDGGSAVLVQKWVHNLTAFEALPLSAQEAVFGRTKEASIQLPDGQMPATSHVSRNTIEDADGNELHIYRRNTMFASLAETGTMYIACANDPSRTDLMLARMFGATGDGLHDALTQFSTAVSGSYYWVPSMDSLTAVFGGLAADDEEPDVHTAVAERVDLGIGSLRDRAE
jgi:putative iron-dependent peroxidase